MRTIRPKNPFHAFCIKYGLSQKKMADMLRVAGDPASDSTIQKYQSNNLSESTVRRINTVLALILPPFLSDQGLSVAEIDAELLTILSEGEYHPMIVQRFELSPQLQKYFNFRDGENRPVDPFRNTPANKDEVFISADLRAVIDRLLDAIRYQGFVSVTGEIGSGKTTLRALLEDHVMQNENLRLVWPEFFDMSSITPMQIADAILSEFGSHRPNSAIKRGQAVKNLLANEARRGTRVAIAFDECHRLNDKAVSSLKNFLEMSSGGFQKHLGVILFGQPQFDSRLAEPQFREIFERIVPIRMPDFKSSAREYLSHRIALAGGKVDQLFDADAVNLICENSPTPLALGNITNKALSISALDFKESRVIGAAIKTRMFFEERQQGFARRAA